MKNADTPAMPIGEQIDGVNMNPNCNGLTKREHFAIKILTGFASNNSVSGSRNEIAKGAIDWADALLEELAK